MKASYAWIREYLPALDAKPETVADWLTFTGTEIESADPVGEDFIFDAGVTSNRADCLCHFGLAREIAAAQGIELVPPKVDATAVGPATSTKVSVAIADGVPCGRYTAQVIEGVKVGPSPKWLQTKLEALGLRSVNNVVDVTNYVLFECGQPLHAFDLDRLAGPALNVRMAAKGEKLTTLDGQELTLDPEDLVIADAVRPVALGGVMGGKDSEVGDDTTRILIESAWFTTRTVRRSARRHGLSTDSSYRFERGVDRTATLDGSLRAARLIMELAGGTLCTKPLDAGSPGEPAAAIALRSSKVASICGIPVAEDSIVSKLEAIGCRVAVGSPLQVTPPAWRHDLTREIDLVEEVVRLQGFHEIPEEGGMGVRVVRPHNGRALRERLSDRLAGFGLYETVTPDFVAEDAKGASNFLADGVALVAETPMRKGEGRLRQSLLPSLLTVRKLNQDQGNRNVRLFEASRLNTLGESAVGILSRPVLGLLIDDDGRAARGVVEALLRHEGLTVEVGPSEAEGLDPAARAELLVGTERIGVYGQPPRALLKAYGLKTVPFYVELDLQVLEGLITGERRFAPLSKFPSIERDLAVLVDESVPFQALMDGVRAAAPLNLESQSLFDVFRGKKIGAGKKSLGLRFVFRSAERTLTHEEVEAQMVQLEAKLTEALGAEIRRG